jgi:squalene-hopene/tetraprenyl-beta-curcumene cyclase
MPFKRLATAAALSAAVLACVLVNAGRAAEPAPSRTWDAAAAARYLDGRLTWWRSWPKAERDHGTHCISCHTALPVALARPILRNALGEHETSPVEQAMYADVVKRVRMWRDVEPFYPDQKSGLPKSSESRAVESVLNALFLTTRDNENGGHLSDDAKQAFANMWSLQMQTGDLKGGFAWLTFKLEPWESDTATYWGAALAAMAIAQAPDNYAASPAIAANVEALRGYLRTAFQKDSSLFTRMLVLWADSNLHGVLEPAQRQATIYQLLAVQSEDGGWSLRRLALWQRRDGTVIADTSDGFATAMITVALKSAGVPATDKPMKAARTWLITHQSAESGGLPAMSINKLREPGSDAYLFMTDAATGMATLALADDLKRGGRRP